MPGEPNEAVAAVPEDAKEVLPVDTPLLAAEALPASCPEVVTEFRAALDSVQIVVLHPTIADGLEILTDDRFKLPFSAVLCRCSGIMYTSLQLVEEDLPVYYERYYHRWQLARSVSKSHGLFQDDNNQDEGIRRRVELHLPSGTDGVSVLAIGSGVENTLTGLSNNAQAAGSQVDALGADYSSECVEIAARRRISIIYGGFGEAVSLRRIDALSKELHRANAFVEYYDDKRHWLWWLSRQMIRSLLPRLDVYLKREKDGR